MALDQTFLYHNLLDIDKYIKGERESGRLKERNKHENIETKMQSNDYTKIKMKTR